MIIPRPCAFKSENMTSVSYYRGQNPLQYQIKDSSGNVATMMNAKSELIYQDGSSAADMATLHKNNYTIFIQTDSEDKIGTQKVIIRNCDELDRLLELNLYIEVLSNTHPDFDEKNKIKTNFDVEVGKKLVYSLPKVEDPEGNDEAVIEVIPMEGQQYPNFLTYVVNNNELIFDTKDEYDAGQTYFFAIKIREKNSQSVSFEYYCTVNVLGD